MAGDWIKWNKGLVRKMEILQLAARLHVPPAHAAGLLMQLMEWVDENVSTFDEHGNAHVTLGPLQSSALDVTLGVTGFMEAMAEVHWIELKGDDLVFIHAGRHNGQTAKARALTSSRVSKHRLKRNCNDPVVTPSSLSLLSSPSVSEWLEAAKESRPDWPKADAEAAWNHYEANGWRIGKNPVKKWQACIPTCYRNWQDKSSIGRKTPVKDPYRAA